MAPPGPSSRYSNRVFPLNAYYASEAEPGSLLETQRSRNFGLSLQESVVGSTGLRISAASSPKYNETTNRIEWLAGLGAGPSIFFNCSNLPLLDTRGLNGFTVKALFSKGSNVNSVSPYLLDIDVKSIPVGTDGSSSLTTLSPSASVVITLAESVLDIAGFYYHTVGVGYYLMQIKTISITITANPSDEVRLHAAWVEYRTVA